MIKFLPIKNMNGCVCMEEEGRARYFILAASFFLIAALILYRTFSVPLLLPIENLDVSASAYVFASTEDSFASNVISSELNTVSETNGIYLININTCSYEDLLSLNGIGPVKAQAIIEYRTLNGGFSSIEEITNVSGIGEKTFESIRGFITV